MCVLERKVAFNDQTNNPDLKVGTVQSISKSNQKIKRLLSKQLKDLSLKQGSMSADLKDYKAKHESEYEKLKPLAAGNEAFNKSNKTLR